MNAQPPSPSSPFKIGTRGSPLALAQAGETRTRLAAAFDLPVEAFEIVTIKTVGDRTLDRDFRELGGKGIFTKEVEDALLEGRVDIAVHSMKDMPAIQPEGLVLDCHLPREDPRDAFVARKHAGIGDLPEGARVGTSSVRRKAQILRLRPDVIVVPFRGNVQTRLEKLDADVADCTFLAMAGLNRLGLAGVEGTPVPVEEMLPAATQGAIGVERRDGDARAAEMLEAIHDGPTASRMAAERAFLAVLEGSCDTPIAALAELEGATLRLRGEILRPDGSEQVHNERSGPVDDGEELGAALARDLLAEAGEGFLVR